MMWTTVSFPEKSITWMKVQKCGQSPKILLSFSYSRPRVRSLFLWLPILSPQRGSTFADDERSRGIDRVRRVGFQKKTKQLVGAWKKHARGRLARQGKPCSWIRGPWSGWREKGLAGDEPGIGFARGGPSLCKRARGLRLGPWLCRPIWGLVLGPEKMGLKKGNIGLGLGPNQNY